MLQEIKRELVNKIGATLFKVFLNSKMMQNKYRELQIIQSSE